MNKEIKIVQASAYIDFHIDATKFRKYKSKVAKFNFVYKVLCKYLDEAKLIGLENVDVRDISTTSNDFWGEEYFLEINDLGFCANNQVELNTEFITLRYFHINLLGLVSSTYDVGDIFQEIKGEHFLLGICSGKVL